ncbi:MAG: hypothetical protein Q8P62_04460 [Candidatus Peregrinibacteria bacterium]|nr:hypothetical protein [Candidatus Peregrinibacteria bacterium]
MSKFFKLFLILSLATFTIACSSNKDEVPVTTTSDSTVVAPVVDNLSSSTETYVGENGYKYSVGFYDRVSKKDRLLVVKDGYGEETVSFGPKPGKFNFSILKPLTWNASFGKDNLYAIKSAKGGGVVSVTYHDNVDDSYTDCKSLVKKLFFDNAVGFDVKNVKDITVDGKVWERVYYDELGEDGPVKFIDQCYKGDQYIFFVDGGVPLKVVKEKKGVMEIGVTYEDLEKVMDDFMFEELL